jgi:hypothetical protein
MILDKKYSIRIAVALSCLITPFLYLLFFPHPIADDLSFGYQAKTTDLLEQLKSTYLTWNGRYAGNFFIQLVPISLENLMLYRIILGASFIVFFLGFYSFIKSVLTKTTLLQLLIISLLGTLTFLSLMPNIAEGFYWYTSVIYYQLSLSFVLFLAAFFFNYLNQQFLINKTFHLVITLFLLLIAVGMNETLALIIPFVCGAFFLSSLLSKNNNKWFFALLALVAIIGSALVVFSPGNAYRMAAYPDNKDMVTSLLMSFLQMGRFLAGFIFSFSGLFYFLFVACFFALSSSSLKQIKSHYLFIGFIVILFLSIFPAYYATGILGQHRTVNIATLFYVLLITLLALKLGKQLKERLPRKPQNMIIYFVLFFFIFGNGRTVALDIFSGRAVEYDAQLTKRSITLNEKKSTKINKLTIKPKSLFVIDVENDSTHWVNQAYVLDLD